MSDDEQYYDGLDDVDREIRLEKLRRELEEAGGMLPLVGDDLPADVEEAFLENLLFYEKAPRTTYAKMIITDGIALPSIELMSHEALGRKLWEVIHALAERQVYLYNTDHLSDGALYRLLWEDYLNHETTDLSLNPDAACHLDVLGSGSEDDILIYLRFYATDAEREEWKRELGQAEMPAREEPPYDRDRFLPKRPLA